MSLHGYGEGGCCYYLAQTNHGEGAAKVFEICEFLSASDMTAMPIDAPVVNKWFRRREQVWEQAHRCCIVLYVHQAVSVSKLCLCHCAPVFLVIDQCLGL